MLFILNRVDAILIRLIPAPDLAAASRSRAVYKLHPSIYGVSRRICASRPVFYLTHDVDTYITGDFAIPMRRGGVSSICTVLLHKI